MPGQMAGRSKSENRKEVQSPFDHENIPTALGTEFVLRFYRLLKGAFIYDPKNVLIDRLTQECLESINPFIRSEGHFFLKIIRENFFFNNIRILVKADKYSLFKSFSEEMKKRWIGEMEITSELAPGDLKKFVFILSKLEGDNESNYLYVQRELQSLAIQTISVGKLEFFKDQDLCFDPEKQRRYSKEIYFKAIDLVKEVMESVKNQKLLNIRKAKHLMQNAVNSIMQEESALLGLANIKNYDEYTFNHSVNVAIYAIALGQRVGFSKKHLSHLGMAGLLHDIGKTKIPPEILNKPEKLTPQDWAVIRSHPVIGAEIVMRVKEWGDLSTRMMDAAFEHHLKYDLTGYPKLARKRHTSLCGRIIALVDFYDALIRPRVYRRFPFVSEKILGLMLEKAGKDFDPALVKVFINMVGIFPLGTLVSLNTNEMGIVVQIQEDPELIDRPKVCLLHYSDGEYRKGNVEDLREVDEETKTFRRTIVKTLDPNEYNIHIAEFLI